ncbi:MAG: hypothetical protein QME96_10385, partial [Myxococcota bacterium]|nr:hypothetical protein [Myxococcota bacterium]
MRRSSRTRRLAAIAAAVFCCSCGIVGVCDRGPGEAGALRRRAGPPGASGADVAVPSAAAWREPERPDAGAPDAAGVLVAGTAAYEKMNVFERPDYASARIGYARRGAEVMVRGPIDAADCGEIGQKWFQLADGGYACAGRGLLIGQPLSQHLFAPPPPDLTGPVPYRYGSIRRNRTPVYKRLPTSQQRQEVAAFLFPEMQEADAGAGAD